VVVTGSKGGCGGSGESVTVRAGAHRGAARADGHSYSYHSSADYDIHFYYLRLLKQCLGPRPLSVALPPRFKTEQDRRGYAWADTSLARAHTFSGDAQ
jgi:hypothetical protein